MLDKYYIVLLRRSSLTLHFQYFVVYDIEKTYLRLLEDCYTMKIQVVATNISKKR